MCHAIFIRRDRFLALQSLLGNRLFNIVIEGGGHMMTKIDGAVVGLLFFIIAVVFTVSLKSREFLSATPLDKGSNTQLCQVALLESENLFAAYEALKADSEALSTRGQDTAIYLLDAHNKYQFGVAKANWFCSKSLNEGVF